ncbi:hypothetical protein FJZ26_05795 [Candidatus Parvarchaeota archaeon]|nr:hypothetical protein [Candidatus Parvarchaeota archaeon]
MAEEWHPRGHMLEENAPMKKSTKITILSVIAGAVLVIGGYYLYQNKVENDNIAARAAQITLAVPELTGDAARSVAALAIQNKLSDKAVKEIKLALDSSEAAANLGLTVKDVIAVAVANEQHLTLGPSRNSEGAPAVEFKGDSTRPATMRQATALTLVHMTSPETRAELKGVKLEPVLPDTTVKVDTTKKPKETKKPKTTKKSAKPTSFNGTGFDKTFAIGARPTYKQPVLQRQVFRPAMRS